MNALATATALAGAPRPWRYPSALVDRLRLRDGRIVVVRPVASFDAPAEQDFVRALSPASRLRRFHFGLKELPPSLLRAMTEVDHRDHVAVIAEALEADDGDALLVADARYVRERADPRAAEFAVAVADDWQGHGLGRALLAHLARHAARHGVQRLWGDVLVGNRSMLALADTLGAGVEPSPEGDDLMRVAFFTDGPAPCRPPANGRGLRAAWPAPAPSRPR
jgi:acetyltransferase